MGKTHQPLNLLVWSAWQENPAIQSLAEKGHTVSTTGDLSGCVDDAPPDLILHPAAHWWDNAMFEKPAYLEAALKAARKRRYGEKKKGGKKK